MENTELQETKEESPLWYENICSDCHSVIYDLYPDIKWDSISNEENKHCERCASGDRASFTIRKPPKCKHGMIEELCGFCLEAKGLLKASNKGNRGELTKYRNFSYESTEGFWKTIGFLASHAQLVAFVIAKNESKFKQQYATLKGHELLGFTLISNEDQWGNELRVVVEYPDWNLDFGNIDPVNSSGNRINLNSNALVWWLLEIGFDLGRNHNVESIKSFVPIEFKEAFDDGYLSN